MTYDHTKYLGWRSLHVDRKTALALANTSAPVVNAAAQFTQMTLIAQLNTGTATTAQIATAVNTLLTELIAAGLMASS